MTVPLRPQWSARCDDVVAVIVTFNPEPAALRALLAALQDQVGTVIVVDNASSSDVAAALVAPATAGAAHSVLVRNDGNLGIAAAQNIGIERALAMSTCRYILLLDDDSVPAADMVRCLRDAMRRDCAGMPIAAVGPITVDLRTGRMADFWLDRLGRRRHWRESRIDPAVGADGVLDVGFLISSGSLIPTPALRAIGGMRANYFIDHVDTEWCLRARRAGYRLLQVPGARLEHRLGEAMHRIWFLRAWDVAYHVPLRDYYLFRNTVLMLRDSAAPPRLAASQVVRLMRFALYYLFMGDLRWRRLRSMTLGLAHGLRRISGRLDAARGVCEALPVTALDPANPAFTPVVRIQVPAGDAMTAGSPQGGFTVSIVSHGQGTLCARLIEDLAHNAAPLIGRLVLTLNIPETPPVLGNLPFVVEIVTNERPLGFGENHNRAFARATSPYFAVLNPDLRIDQDPFPTLRAILADPQVGIAAPLVREADGSIADFARPLVTPAQVLRRRLRRAPGPAHPQHPDWIAGMFLAFRSQTYADLGGFDTRYFLYCEDVDICARARLRGLRLAMADAVSVTHLAQRASHRSLRYLRLHAGSLLRLWTSRAYRDYRRLLRAQR